MIDKINLGYGAIIAGLTALLGEYWILFAGFLALNVVDWVTGMLKARMNQESSSINGARGALKKVGYWVVIGIAFFISGSFVLMGRSVGINLDFVGLFGWLTLAMYLVNEMRSILENLVQMGVAVPAFLVKGLDVTKKLLETQSGGKDEDKADTGEVG